MRRALARPARLLAVLVVIAVGVLGPAEAATAHPLSTSAVLLDVGADRVDVTVELPLDELGVARDQVLTAKNVLAPSTLAELRDYVREHLTATDARSRVWTTTVSGGRVEKVDGVDDLVLDAALTPGTGRVGDFVLHYDAVIDLLASHRVFVSGRYGHSGAYTTLAMLSWQTTSVPVASSTPGPQQDFGSAVQLGIGHIAGGSDHLLFLVMLLLPAPLVAAGGRWRRRTDTSLLTARRSLLRVLHVVTAFAVGHTCTLVLGALGWIDLPTRLVESGIALSVLVSAVHAVRPLVRRGEVLIAGGFGLLHGLAFATLLGSLDLERSNLLVTLLGFNVGIELAQLIVVALVMPSLLLLSGLRGYAVVRIGLAAIGGVLAVGWLADRTGLVRGDPLEPVANVLVDAPIGLAGGFALCSVLLVAVVRLRRPMARRRRGDSTV